MILADYYIIAKTERRLLCCPLSKEFLEESDAIIYILETLSKRLETDMKNIKFRLFLPFMPICIEDDIHSLVAKSISVPILTGQSEL